MLRPCPRRCHGENGRYVSRLINLSFPSSPVRIETYFESLHLSILCDYPLNSPHQGFGSVIQMYPGGEPLRPGVDSFGFPSHFHDMLHEFPICHVNALLAGTLDTKAKDPNTGTANPRLINRRKKNLAIGK